MKYNETFYCYIRNTQENGNDFLIKVLGATYKENPRLFVYKNEQFDSYVLVDKDTGMSICSGKSLKEMSKKYHDRYESLYNKTITINFEYYKKKIKAFKQLLKENLIGEILGVAR